MVHRVHGRDAVDAGSREWDLLPEKSRSLISFHRERHFRLESVSLDSLFNLDDVENWWREEESHAGPGGNDPLGSLSPAERTVGPIDFIYPILKLIYRLVIGGVRYQCTRIFYVSIPIFISRD